MKTINHIRNSKEKGFSVLEYIGLVSLAITLIIISIPEYQIWLCRIQADSNIQMYQCGEPNLEFIIALLVAVLLSVIAIPKVIYYKNNIHRK